MFTRQRIRQGMRKAYQHRCHVCAGTGWMRTAESHSLSLMRRIETRLAQGGVGEVRVKTHRETAEYLNNQRRSQLLAMEKQYGCNIVIVARPDIDRSHDEVQFLSHGELLAEITDKLPPRERRKERRSRRRKKRRKASADEAAPEAATEKKRKKKKSRKAEEPAPAIEAKGDTSFTGRPSPEMLAKMKAEREERKRRRAEAKGQGGDAADVAPKDPSDAPANPKTKKASAEEAPTKPPAKPRRRRTSQRPKKADAASETSVGFSATVEKGESSVRPKPAADDAERRKSLLDRIFGSR